MRISQLAAVHVLLQVIQAAQHILQGRRQVPTDPLAVLRTLGVSWCVASCILHECRGGRRALMTLCAATKKRAWRSDVTASATPRQSWPW